MNIEYANKSDAREIVELLVSCFKDDPYFKSVFSNEKDFKVRMIGITLMCLEYGEIIVTKECGKIASMLLQIDYSRLREQGSFARTIILDYESAESERLSEVFDALADVVSSNLTYLVLGCTHEKFRNKGLLSKCLKYSVNRTQARHFLADCDNKVTKKLCEAFGFEKLLATENTCAMYLDKNWGVTYQLLRTINENREKEVTK